MTEAHGDVAEKVSRALESASLKTGMFTSAYVPLWMQQKAKRFSEDPQFTAAHEAAEHYRGVEPRDALQRVMVRQLWETVDAAEKAYNLHEDSQRKAARAKEELDRHAEDLAAILSIIGQEQEA